MLAIAEAMSSEGKWHLAQYYVLKEMLKDLRAMASEWCDQCATCTSTTSEEKMEENSGDEVGKSFWQWGLKDMVAWWKGEEQKVEKADQELAEMDEAEKKELLQRMAGAQVAGVGNAAGGHPSLDHHPTGHPSVGGSAGQVESSLSKSFFQHMAQDLLDLKESATVDAEMVKELHHAYRLVSSSSITAQFNLHTGLAGMVLRRSPSGGSRRAPPTLAFTSTRLPSSSRCCDECNLFSACIISTLIYRSSPLRSRRNT